MCVAVGLIERYAKEGENLFSFSFSCLMMLICAFTSSSSSSLDDFYFFFSSSSSIYAIASLSLFFGLSRLIKSHIRRAIQRELRDGAIPSRKLLLLLLLTEWLGKHKQKPLPTERNFGCWCFVGTAFFFFLLLLLDQLALLFPSNTLMDLSFLKTDQKSWNRRRL